MTNPAQSGILQLWQDAQQTAAKLGVTCNEQIWSIIQAFENEFMDYLVSMRITSRHNDQLNLRYMTLDRTTDAYARCVERGFLTPTDHPVYTVMPTLRERYRDTSSYSIDIGVTHGLEKIWALFDPPIASIDEVCALDFIPESVKSHRHIFKKYGLEDVGIIGVDYISKTLNLYWLTVTYPNSPELSSQLVTDLGFPAPSAEDNAFNGSGFVVYTTHSWDTDHIERVSYAHAGPANEIPTHWPASIHQFADTVILRGPARVFTFNTCYGRGVPNYYKIEADYRTTFKATMEPLGMAAMKQAQARGFDITKHDPGAVQTAAD